MNKTLVAGGVVLNKSGKVLVVSQGDSWSLPKGHIESGETAQDTAVREIKEESGISDVTFVKELGEYERFRIGANGIGEDSNDLRRITMFLYTTTQFELKPEDPENPEARWVAPRDVAKLLTHPKDQSFFESILPDVERL
jgi:ADP-ribose pyrophosphatase YjhB (NUDIX family)